MIEAAALGVPISFGPDTENFKEAVQVLMDCDGAKVVSDRNELQQFVQWAILSVAEAAEMGQRARRAMLDQQGGLKRTAAIIGKVLNQQRSDIDSRNAA